MALIINSSSKFRLTNFHRICIVQSAIDNRQSAIKWGGGADISSFSAMKNISQYLVNFH
jgi:hypothetical protein